MSGDRTPVEIEPPRARWASLVGVLDRAGRGVALLTHGGERLQLRIYAWRVALDPESRDWAKRVHEDVANGAGREGAKSQDDFRRLLEERRSTR
jgi:hypothetical protein